MALRYPPLPGPPFSGVFVKPQLKLQWVMLAAALAAVPALAADVTYNGHTLQFADGQDSGPIQRMLGAQYNFPGTAADIIGRAQTCATGVAGLTVESADPASGALVLRASTEFRSGFSSRPIRSRIDIAAAEAAYVISESEIQVQQGSAEAGFTPLTHGEGGWEKGLDALIGLENKVTDCLYR